MSLSEWMMMMILHLIEIAYSKPVLAMVEIIRSFRGKLHQLLESKYRDCTKSQLSVQLIVERF